MALVTSDLHIGSNRISGATPATQSALRDHIRNRFESLLHDSGEDQVIINGDLFNGFTVDTFEVIDTYRIIRDWLIISPSRKIHIIAGNHDHNPRGTAYSSFHTLCWFLESHYPNQVAVFDRGFDKVMDNVWCVPHMPNQSLFDLEIEKAIANPSKFLLLHCNYKNTFADASDQSLNLSDEQVGHLMRAGWTLILGHEHVGEILREGRVVIVGNPFPASISDCIGDPFKHMLKLDNVAGTYQLVQTWDHLENYIEVDWKDLTNLDGYQFIRVTGDAAASQAADVVNAVAKLRQRSSAYVIGNATRIEGAAEITDMTSLVAGEVEKFDVVGAILKHLDADECEIVKELLKC